MPNRNIENKEKMKITEELAKRNNLVQNLAKLWNFGGPHLVETSKSELGYGGSKDSDHDSKEGDEGLETV